MTIRSGGRPRERRGARKHVYAPDAYATESIPEFSEPVPTNRSGRGGGGGTGSSLIGFIKFLIFALVLAAVVIGVALTALRPVMTDAVMRIAEDNPAALRFPFVKDIVAENLGDALTAPVSTDPEQLQFLIEPGQTASQVALKLQEEGLLRDSRAFVYIAVVRDLTGDLQQGTFILRKNMTPDQLVSALLAPPTVKFVDIALRTSLRLEQITAKLQTLPLTMDVEAFYELAKSPPTELIDDYPWLKRILADAPTGASLEGFLWPATYRVLPDTSPEELVRLMLDRFAADVGVARMTVAKERGLNFYQVLTLASIVEREAVLDSERPLIAGVYQNRIDGIPGIKNRILNADPTVFYAIDTLELAKLKFEDWQRYAFWSPPGVPLADVSVPEALQGYQTYQTAGLVPGPICTPSLPSIDAALEPDTKDQNIYFLAIPDSGGEHAFATTKAQHDNNRKKYGYIQ
ncbi:MAG: endolytic transglycosylase MltG [Chloroflexi bacterium]|nr:endolytic transglycosylase MltG [Chloroflexota bacterium]